ncbi:hypothetical protein EN837_26115, partial [bacterium M00.F.Ca.ET.194.01.1.1]
GTGLGRFKPQGLKTPGSFQTYLLFTMYSEQASVLQTMQTFISSKKTIRSRRINSPVQRGSASPIVRRPRGG